MTANAFDAWLKRNRRPKREEIASAIRGIAAAQPSMAPLWRLANDLGLASEESRDPHRLAVASGKYRRRVLTARRRIAHEFARFVRPLNKPEIVTYSYSSTVAEALIRSRRWIWGVSCSESRPGNEGQRMARELARKGIRVTYDFDAGLFSQLHSRSLIVLGADALLPGFVAAKTGSRAIVRLASQLRAQVIFLVDTSKFFPERRDSYRWDWTWGEEKDLWDHAPRGVTVYNLLMELIQIPSHLRLRFITERGPMTPRQVRRHLAKIRLSALLFASPD